MENPKLNRAYKKNSSDNFFQKEIKSFGFALKGVFYFFRTQPHARFHLSAGIAVTVLGFLFKISTTEWCILALTYTIVISAEAFNTAIETVVDLVSPEFHALAGRAKDIAAGAVLIAAAGAVIVGLIIFLPHFF